MILRAVHIALPGLFDGMFRVFLTSAGSFRKHLGSKPLVVFC